MSPAQGERGIERASRPALVAPHGAGGALWAQAALPGVISSPGRSRLRPFHPVATGGPGRPSAHVAVSTARRLSSIRDGYVLTLAPGWSVLRGDCAPYAVIGAGHAPNTLQIRVATSVLSGINLAAAEAAILATSGTWQGVGTRRTLRLHAATFLTTSVRVRSATAATYGMLVAGVARNHLTYLVVERVRDPAARAGKQAALAEQGMLASLTFLTPAAPGSYTCAGTGISRPAPRQSTRPAVATATHTATPSPTSTPLAATGTSIATSVPSATGTATPSPSSTVPPTGTPPPTLTATASATATPTPNGIPTSGSTDNGCPITPQQASGEAYLLGLLNADRAGAGAPPLTLLPALSVVARDHSCDMGEHNKFSHIGSDGSDPASRITGAGIPYNTYGENLGTADGYDLLPGVAAIDQAMMAEPNTYGTHHYNIVNPAFTTVGIGIIVIGSSLWITEDFVG